MHWRKGPEWWTNISPKLFIGAAALIFIILPLFTLAYMVYIFLHPDNSFLNVFCIYFMSCFSIKPFEFYVHIWRLLVPEAQFYLKIKQKIKE